MMDQRKLNLEGFKNSGMSRRIDEVILKKDYAEVYRENSKPKKKVIKEKKIFSGIENKKKISLLGYPKDLNIEKPSNRMAVPTSDKTSGKRQNVICVPGGGGFGHNRQVKKGTSGTERNPTNEESFSPKYAESLRFLKPHSSVLVVKNSKDMLLRRKGRMRSGPTTPKKNQQKEIVFKNQRLEEGYTGSFIARQKSVDKSESICPPSRSHEPSDIRGKGSLKESFKSGTDERIVLKILDKSKAGPVIKAEDNGTISSSSYLNSQIPTKPKNQSGLLQDKRRESTDNKEKLNLKGGIRPALIAKIEKDPTASSLNSIKVSKKQQAGFSPSGSYSIVIEDESLMKSSDLNSSHRIRYLTDRPVMEMKKLVESSGLFNNHMMYNMKYHTTSKKKSASSSKSPPPTSPSIKNYTTVRSAQILITENLNKKKKKSIAKEGHEKAVQNALKSIKKKGIFGAKSRIGGDQIYTKRPMCEVPNESKRTKPEEDPLNHLFKRHKVLKENKIEKLIHQSEAQKLAAIFLPPSQKQVNPIDSYYHRFISQSSCKTAVLQKKKKRSLAAIVNQTESNSNLKEIVDRRMAAHTTIQKTTRNTIFPFQNISMKTQIDRDNTYHIKDYSAPIVPQYLKNVSKSIKSIV